MKPVTTLAAAPAIAAGNRRRLHSGHTGPLPATQRPTPSSSGFFSLQLQNTVVW